MDKSVWIEVFRVLVTNVPEFVYPEWFAYVADQIPVENSRARRDVPRLLSLLEVIALCRSFSDARREKGKSIEINFADYCVSYQILHEAFASTYGGAHFMALKFAEAVRDLCDDTKRPVLTNDVMEHLNWEKALAHKWRVIAVRAKLVRYDEGTYPMNKKPLLPGPAQRATAFLPDPQLVFNERQDIDDTTFIDPLSGEEKAFRREPKKPSKK